MADSIAERVQRRRNSHVEDEDNIVQASEVSLGEKVLLCELIREPETSRVRLGFRLLALLTRFWKHLS